MSRKQEYEEKTCELLDPILTDLGMEAVDVEFVKEAGEYYLRCYINKEGGITIDDCEKVSKRLEASLDESALIDEAYILEVSSPGVGRALRRPGDFRYAMGKMVELRTYRETNGKREDSGILAAWDKDTVTLRGDDGAETTYMRKDISHIKLSDDL